MWTKIYTSTYSTALAHLGLGLIMLDDRIHMGARIGAAVVLSSTHVVFVTSKLMRDYVEALKKPVVPIDPEQVALRERQVAAENSAITPEIASWLKELSECDHLFKYEHSDCNCIRCEGPSKIYRKKP